MPQTLTQDFVNSVILPSGRKLIADKHAKGLYLDLWPKGRAWRFRYTGLDGKMKAITIGDAAEVPLDEARKQAKALGAFKRQRCWFPRGTEPVFPPRSEPPLSIVF